MCKALFVSQVEAATGSSGDDAFALVEFDGDICDDYGEQSCQHGGDDDVHSLYRFGAQELVDQDLLSECRDKHRPQFWLDR